MPEEEKKTVDIDTSGPEVNIDIEETKDESVVETEAPKEETTEQGTDKTFENERETKLEEKKDENLEEYSKGVQARIAKLTRKMREAERREKAATEYARAVEEKRKVLEQRFEKTDANYSKKFETTNVGGTLTGNLTVSGEITANSDASLKENILPISNPLDIIDSIKGVQFNFKDRQKEDISYGFLAQEMEKILPSIVHETDPKQNTLGIAYNNIIAILLEGVKSLSDEVKELKNKIEK